MKMQNKIFKALTGEPAVVQQIDGRQVEIHYMNDTPFLAQFAGRGRFAEWTSDGKAFKLIVEKGYFEAMDGFYTEEINKVWINFLVSVGKKYRKVTAIFLGGIALLYLIVALVGILWFPDQLTNILIGSLIVVLGANIVQTRYVRKYIANENTKARDAIVQALGDKKYNELLQKQDEYYKAYYKFDEETTETEATEIDTENESTDNGDEDHGN
jgi:hypothetical protein